MTLPGPVSRCQRGAMNAKITYVAVVGMVVSGTIVLGAGSAAARPMPWRATLTGQAPANAADVTGPDDQNRERWITHP